MATPAPPKFKDSYRKGAEGFIKFCEENVRVSVTKPGDLAPKWVYLKNLPDNPHPVTGRSFKSMWERHKEVARECLVMKRGTFIYTLIVFCWMRGDGKSFLVCLIFIWKWLNFPKQQLVLCANSKDQSTFVHYDEIKKIIENSPRLLDIVGERNIQRNELRLRDGKGNVVSRIFSATTFTGVLSNIGGYTFSEFFDLKNHKFFEEIDTSLRNTTNAFGIIDTTVSSKSHPLYHLYKSAQSGKAKTIYFSYRCSPNGKAEDFWHPNMTQDQLDSFKIKHHVGKGFDRFFKNTWEAAEGKVFSEDEIESIYYLGVHNQLGSQKKLLSELKRRHNIQSAKNKIEKNAWKKTPGHSNFVDSTAIGLSEIEKSLWPVDNIYQLKDRTGHPRQCTVDELTALGNLYDTDWAIMIGMDRAGEGGLDKRTKARTIITAIAKGLPNSRTRPEVGTIEAPDYLYILLNLSHVQSGRANDIKAVINEIECEYGSIETYFSETWSAGDLRDFCEEKDIRFEIKQPTLGLQKAMFIEMYQAISCGRFKSARVFVEGSRGDNILSEELGMFEHDADKKSFGSPEKKDRNGVQDDVVFAIALTIYGGRFLTVDDFENRSPVEYFGGFYPDKRLVGFYNQ